MAAAVAALFLCAPPAPASALDFGEWLPGFRLTPFISERIEYESNVFLVPSGATDDVIFRTIPGLLAEYVAGPNALSVGYRAEILNFLKLTDQDKTHHFVVGQAHFEFARLTLNLRDDYVETSDPPGTELTGRIVSRTNTIAPEADYRLTERFGVGVNGGWTTVTFPTVPQLDRDELLAGASVFWKALPKADLRLNYNYGEKDFDSATNRDVTRHVVLVGIRGDITARLSSTFRWGYEIREPERPNLKSYRGLVGGGDWIYRPTDRTKFSLLTERSVQESTFGSQLFYVSTIATLLAEQQFGPKVTANLRMTGGDNTYPTKETLNGVTKFRQDTIIGWGAGLSYEIQKWLRVGLDYAHTTRESNFRSFNFQDDKVSTTVTLQF